MFDPRPDLVDYHCHLDLYQDYVERFRACETKRIATFAVTTTPLAWPRTKELSAGSKYVRAGLGFHPQLVAERADEIRLFEKHLGETRFIGEVGLDASPQYYPSFQKQKEVFEKVLQLCEEAGGKILTVHSVRAGRQVLDLLEKHLSPNRTKVVIHWFSGTPSEAKRAAQLGCYFSLNKQMFNKPERHVMIASLPINRILTETDGPFTTTNGNPSRPEDVKSATPLVSRVFGKSEEEIKLQITQNLNRLESVA